MRPRNLLLIVPILFLADCGARTGLEAGVGGEMSIGAATATGGAAVTGGAPGTGGASAVNCGLAGAAGASSTFVGVVTILSAIPTCQCPNNSQCLVGGHGQSDGCYPTPCDAAQYGLQYCVKGEPLDYPDHFCIPGNLYVCWVC